MNAAACLRLKRFLIFLFFIVLQSAYAQTMILSPAEGVWANYQSLVLNLPKGAEAYYSLTEADPQLSGLAYDGPVLIDIAGDVQLKLVVVFSDGTNKRFNLKYTVLLQPAPAYIPLGENPAFIAIKAGQKINIPKEVFYSLGTSKTFLAGTELALAADMLFEHSVALNLHDGPVPYRYILKTGGFMPDTNPDTEIISLAAIDAPIYITNWNYVQFTGGGPIIYGIDTQMLKKTQSGTIFVDRSQDHFIHWRKDSSDNINGFSTFFLPARPQVLGMPEKPALNSAVSLRLSDSRFVFGWENQTGETVFSPVFVLDALSGDAFGFSQTIYIYYEGIKQGTISPAFIIDKIPPDPPQIISSENFGYSRLPVTLGFQASEELLCYVPPPLMQKDAFEARSLLPPAALTDIDSNSFLPLKGNSLILKPVEGNASFYTVYACTRDIAGNMSKIITYQTIIDPYNYYLIQDEAAWAGLKDKISGTGTKEDPFIDFSQVLEVLNVIDGQRFFIAGTFTDVPPIVIGRDTEIYGGGTSRLIFDKDADIKIENSSLLIAGCSLEQNSMQQSNILQNYFLTAKHSVLSINDCELVFCGGKSASGLLLDSSALEISNSGITVQSSVYAAGISALSSVLSAKNLRLVIKAETAVGLSSVQSSALIADSQFIFIASLPRAMEFTRSSFSVLQNNFIAEQKTTGAALWMDEISEKQTARGNLLQGFASLFGGR